VIAVCGVRPELGTCSALSVGRVPQWGILSHWVGRSAASTSLGCRLHLQHSTCTRRRTWAVSACQRPAFVVFRTVQVRMYPHVQGRLCTPTKQTIRKKQRTQIYANKGSMATTLKQNLRTGMGRASAGRCRACTHNEHAWAWRTHAMNMYAHAMGFVNVDCVNVNAAGNLRA